MDTDANKAVVRRYVEMWNTGNVALADELLAPTYVDHAHPEIVGPEIVKRAMPRILAGIPGFHITIDQMLSESDLVALHCTIRGVRAGNTTTSHIMWFVRIVDGRMVDLWTGIESAYTW